MIGADIQILMPEIVLAVFAMAALMAAVYTTKDALAPLLTWGTSGLFVLLAIWIGVNGQGTNIAFGGMFVDDGFARFAKIVILMSAAAVLAAYKRQPIIEKRFSQLKTDFCVAPVHLQEISRIHSLLCIYFLVLCVQTLLERELRQAMAAAELESLPLYPEDRACRASTSR